MGVVEGVKMELDDCAFPLLTSQPLNHLAYGLSPTDAAALDLTVTRAFTRYADRGGRHIRLQDGIRGHRGLDQSTLAFRSLCPVVNQDVTCPLSLTLTIASVLTDARLLR